MEYKTRLEGKALCLARVDGVYSYVITRIEIPAVSVYEYQRDGGFVHREGTYEYNIADARCIDPKDYIKVNYLCDMEIGQSEIEYIKKVLQHNLYEVEE